MGEVVYILCALTSMMCAVLLGRAFYRTRASILLWSTLCFCLLAVNNILLYLDLVVFPPPSPVDLRLPRGLVYLAALMLLVFGLIWDSD
ncbi:MAG TPA: DUF5985 family protein [Phycisphaerae bacterium]|nr:DUF5985 family protein [Phycisphaerae bacterium]